MCDYAAWLVYLVTPLLWIVFEHWYGRVVCHGCVFAYRHSTEAKRNKTTCTSDIDRTIWLFSSDSFPHFDTNYSTNLLQTQRILIVTEKIRHRLWPFFQQQQRKNFTTWYAVVFYISIVDSYPYLASNYRFDTLFCYNSLCIGAEVSSFYLQTFWARSSYAYIYIFFRWCVLSCCPKFAIFDINISKYKVERDIAFRLRNDLIQIVPANPSKTKSDGFSERNLFEWCYNPIQLRWIKWHTKTCDHI